VTQTLNMSLLISMCTKIRSHSSTHRSRINTYW